MQADKIFYHGLIHTMAGAGLNNATTMAESSQLAYPDDVQAIAIKDNKILAVGSDEEICALAGEGTQMIDLKGACICPGFNDSHCHIMLTGMKFRRLSLRGAKSVEEIIERGKAYIREHDLQEGEWIWGDGYDHNIFDEPRILDGRDAEAISTQFPVVLERVCGHIACANSKALEIIGYDENTYIEGGLLEKDEEGRLTGVIVEAALDEFKNRGPHASEALIREIFLDIQARANACGLTSMQTDDWEGVDLDALMKVESELEAEGKMTIRIWEEIQTARMPVLNEFLARGLKSGDGTPFFKIGNIKLLTDGSLGSRTANMRKEYLDDPGNTGVQVYEQEDLDEIVLTAHKAGLQMACHAIGDGAAEQVISAYTKAWEYDHKDLRNRIVHGQFIDDDQMEKMLAAHIAVDAQPPFIPSDVPLLESRMGVRADKMGYRWASLKRKGIHIAGGSDSPVESFAPLWGIYCAVNRPASHETAHQDPIPAFLPGEALTPREALELYTTDAAYFSFEENEKGKLLPGYLADFVILEESPLRTDPRKIDQIKVLATYVDGRCVYHPEEIIHG